MAVLISELFTMIGVSVGIGGILGNFSALIHLNLVSPLFVRNMRLPPFSSSIRISLSCTSDTYDMRNFDDIVKRPSTSTSTHFSTIYSIAISRLFPVRTRRPHCASIRIFSSIGVRLLLLVACPVASIARRNMSVCIRKRMNIGGRK